MCEECDEDNALIATLEAAKTDRSLVTDELLSKLIERVETERDQRVDRDVNGWT